MTSGLQTLVPPPLEYRGVLAGAQRTPRFLLPLLVSAQPGAARSLARRVLIQGCPALSLWAAWGPAHNRKFT